MPLSNGFQPAMTGLLVTYSFGVLLSDSGDQQYTNVAWRSPLGSNVALTHTLEDAVPVAFPFSEQVHFGTSLASNAALDIANNKVFALIDSAVLLGQSVGRNISQDLLFFEDRVLLSKDTETALYLGDRTIFKASPKTAFEPVFETTAENAFITAVEVETFDNQDLSVETMLSSVELVSSDEEYALASQAPLNNTIHNGLSADIVSSGIQETAPTVLAEVDENQGDRSILSGDLIEADLIEADWVDTEVAVAPVSEPPRGELVVARAVVDMAAMNDTNTSISIETLGLGTMDGLMIASGDVSASDGVTLVNLNQVEGNIGSSVSLLTSVEDDEIDFDNLAVTGQMAGDMSFPVMLI